MGVTTEAVVAAVAAVAAVVAVAEVVTVTGLEDGIDRIEHLTPSVWTIFPVVASKTIIWNICLAYHNVFLKKL